MKRKLNVRDIVYIALIGVIFGAIFMGTDTIYNVLTVSLTPLGVGPMANDILMGLWCMAGPLAGMLIRLPFAALFGEVVGAAMEVLFGGQFGAATLISGLTQGAGSELGFVMGKYRRYDWVTLMWGATFMTTITFVYDYFKNGYSQFSLGLNILYFAVRWISMVIFNVVLVKLINDLLVRAHVVKVDAD